MDALTTRPLRRSSHWSCHRYCQLVHSAMSLLVSCASHELSLCITFGVVFVFVHHIWSCLCLCASHWELSLSLHHIGSCLCASHWELSLSLHHTVSCHRLCLMHHTVSLCDCVSRCESSLPCTSHFDSSSFRLVHHAVNHHWFCLYITL